MTDSNGVATLTASPRARRRARTPAPSSPASREHQLAAANGTGDLVVSQAPTSLGSVSGTATFGGYRHLDRHAHILGHERGGRGRDRELHARRRCRRHGRDRQQRRGHADRRRHEPGRGTDIGGVVASYAGSTNFVAASNATGDLVVSQAPTSLGTVGGTATGGLATLTATLTSLVTNAGIAGETVDFTLDGVPVGSIMTDASGVATLPNVPTSDGTGTDSGGVVASYAGSANYVAAADGTGDLIVS